jgi:RimJ/RimL family protein N-acetyltransferase
LIREAPRIETERLVLRAFVASDIEPIVAMWAKEDVSRYIGGRALGREEAWRKALAACGQWAVLGYGYWIAELKSDRQVVGQLGFADFKREMEPSIEGLPELGYVFDTCVHGQGIAFEACVAALDWADTTLNVASYPAIISPQNEASIRLAERLGFAREADAIYHDEPIALFRRPARQ